MSIDFQKAAIIIINIIIIIVIIIVVAIKIILIIMMMRMMMIIIIIIIIIILITNLSRPIVHSAGFHHKQSDYSSLQEHARDRSPYAHPVHQQSSFDKHHL